ncbi:tRNA lysidine(34) synthetase TilS [Ferruginibacter sp. SUN106]|uniref:tRNA lysidine(34) synthetase TilS n=1 Tax=Ferruginibacter sp. SUN106 TaxID=2978348 RepID=UPI003D35CF3B
MILQKQFTDYIKKENLFHPKDKLLLAVSGGVDSAVLCALCKQAGFDFAIAHCNFQLRGEDSKRDEVFVQSLSEQYSVAFHVISFDTNTIAKQQKKSVEEVARDLRYAWFEQLRIDNGYNYIVTAHHADDNVETVLMNFFRGTGIKGLHGILPKQNKIIRPLLFANKKELIAFAIENKLQFVTDYTNTQNDFTRNYFRNELIPAVQKVFPAANENILKNINRLAEAEQLYNQAIEMYKKKLLEIRGNEIHIPVLKLQKLMPLSSIVYEIIKDYGFTALQTEEVIGLLQSESGKYVQSLSYRIIRNRKWLIISPNKTENAQNILIEETDKKIFFESGVLEIEKSLPLSTINNQLSTAQLDASEIQFPLLLRKWKQGDYFYPLGMQKKKKLSRFFIDQKLSLTQKENVWVIETNKKILWVIGLRIDNRFKITDTTKQILQIAFKKTGE